MRLGCIAFKKRTIPNAECFFALLVQPNTNPVSSAKDITLSLHIHSSLSLPRRPPCYAPPILQCAAAAGLVHQVQVASWDRRLQNKEKEEAKASKEAKAAADPSTQAADAPASAAPSSPTPTPKPSPTQALQAATAQRAQRFQKQYFDGSSSCLGAQTDGMRQLRSICSQLASPGKVQELLSLLQDQETANISTFEFLTSGAVHQLREYLAGSDLMKGKSKVHVDSQKLLQRLHAFWEAAMTQGKDGTPPMQSLVGPTHSSPAVPSMHHLPLPNKSSLLAFMVSPFWQIVLPPAATTAFFELRWKSKLVDAICMWGCNCKQVQHACLFASNRTNSRCLLSLSAHLELGSRKV